MRPMILLLAALLLPTAAAMPPFVETWVGEAHVRVFLPDRTTACSDAGPAMLVVEREMERATFLLTMAGPCAPTHAFRGALTPHGWRFDDEAGLASGGLTWDAHAGVWRLDALVDACPPGTICEFPGGVRVRGVFPGGTVVV